MSFFWPWSPPREPETKSLVCPHCMQAIAVTRTTTICPAPSATPHKLHPKTFADGERLPLLFLPHIGFSGVGKTTGLRAQLAALEKLPALWPAFSIEPRTDSSIKIMGEVRGGQQAGGSLPDMTAELQAEPYVFALDNLPRWHSTAHRGRTLVVRDMPGEVFAGSLTTPPEVQEVLSKARTAVMMFSLADLEDPTRNTAHFRLQDLMTVYLNTLEAAGVNLADGRHAIVVTLTQADRLWDERNRELFDLPQPLIDYVTDDPLCRPAPPPDFDLGEYLKLMARQSDRIKEYLLARSSQLAPIRLLVNLAEGRKVRLRFVLTSSLGRAANDGNVLNQDAISRRVLDPLFSALELEGQSR